MRKIVVFFLLTVAGRGVGAQVLINLQLPPSGLIIKSQLWNFSLVNTSATAYDIEVEITLTDLSNNQRVLTGTSKLFQLPRGAKPVRPADVIPVTWNVTGSGYNIDAGPDGFLPIGRFMVCFSVLRINSDLTEKLADECETIEVEPISPPALVSPSDSEQVELAHPLFTWLPPSPFTLFNNLLYDWVLVEVAPLQTGPTAIQQNIPLLSRTNLTVTNMQYPLASPALDTAKIYAWQVSAKNNNSVIAQSEVWTFRLKVPGHEATTVINRESFYARLKREEDASFVLSYGKLNYVYLHEGGNGIVKLRLLDISGRARKEMILDSASYNVKPGENFRQLDLSANGLTPGHQYLLQLINPAGERWYVKFEFRKPD